VRWIAGKTDGKVAADLSDNVLRDAFRARKTGGSSALRDAERAACDACFAAGTRVATPHGGQAIESLHVGDVVQAENPATGKVEAEAVQTVIQDPVSPLVAVDLSDGSAITVTADHPFWVDSGAQLAGAGWFAAGRLQAGDELRTASGAPVMVVGLRHDVGTAVVYTLTVANDHTFFVGSARVLVHNATCGFSTDTVASAFQGMRSGGGHAMQHLIDEGLIPNAGSLQTRAAIFQRLISPILTHPSKTFDWRVGNTLARAFAGEAGGKRVVVFVAKAGPYQGRVISAVVPTAKQVAEWGLP